MPKCSSAAPLIASHDGPAMGNFGIIEAPSKEDAMVFATGDPYVRGGIVGSIELIALPTTFQAQRIDAMTK